MVPVVRLTHRKWHIPGHACPRSLIVGRWAVHSRHGHAEEAIIHAELSAMVYEVAHHEHTKQLSLRSLDEHLIAAPHRPDLVETRVVHFLKGGGQSCDVLIEVGDEIAGAVER